MATVEERLAIIEQRNARVEADKAWETSWTRRGILLVTTYVFIGLYMWIINVDRPWLNAIIPTAGFFISTLTMAFFKELWLRYHHK